jgi:phosphoribosylglycinamide formyltransferase 1
LEILLRSLRKDYIPMLSPKYRIAILASGNGSNAEAIIQYFKNHPTIKVTMLLSNNPGAFALERAKKVRIQARAFTREEFNDPKEVLDWLHQEKITHIALAGFLWLMPHSFLRDFPGRIINIHPALLPRYGGKGMYGLKVHQAVKAAGDPETGFTIHLVNENYDEGKIIFQSRCPVLPHYSAEEIADCVQKLEREHFPREIEKWILRSAI